MPDLPRRSRPALGACAPAWLPLAAALWAGCSAPGWVGQGEGGEADALQPGSVVRCEALPARVGVGAEVAFSAEVSGDPPLAVVWEFGDGARARTPMATHRYRVGGIYEAEVTASNPAGWDTCRVRVEVADPVCAGITGLNAVYFGTSAFGLNQEARRRLDENVGVLERCPSLCVEAVGFADSREPNAEQISARRAGEVRAYYEGRGLAAGRVALRAAGVAPDDDYGEDRGVGSRRAESVVAPCR